MIESDQNLAAMTVAEIVTQNIKTADIFKKNGIDFCCGGNVLLPQICQKKGLNVNTIITDILDLEADQSLSHNFDAWDLDFLSDYIINTHHKYVAEANDLIVQYSDKVAKVHGHHYKEVVDINLLFHELVIELNTHMHKEEMVLFPYIKQLSKARRTGTTINLPPFGTIKNPINMMEAEHDGAGDIIKRIETLTNHFTPPPAACNTFRALYAKLEEFQSDLFQHIHLENNILFPKAIRLESALLSKQNLS